MASVLNNRASENEEIAEQRTLIEKQIIEQSKKTEGDFTDYSVELLFL
jgi:hypothetical protein